MRLAPLAATIVTGCGGGGEDFAVEVKRPVAAVFAPLSAVDFAEARAVFAGLRIDRSRPSDNELLFTIPGSDDVTSTVRLRLEPVRGGEATMIHAAVDVPAVHAQIDGQEKVLSESRLEGQLKQVLEATGRSLEMGSRAGTNSQQLAGLLTAVAISTNKKYLAQAMDLKNRPERLLGMLAAFGGTEEANDSRRERDEPMVNLDHGEHAADFASARSEWQQEEAMRKAAEPATDLDRETSE